MAVPSSYPDSEKTLHKGVSESYREHANDPEKTAFREPVVSADNVGDNVNRKLANPLAGMTRDQLIADAERFAKEHDMLDIVDELRRGAIRGPSIVASLL